MESYRNFYKTSTAIGGALLASLCLAPVAIADGVKPSSGQFGTVGIIDMPTAGMRDSRTVAWSYSRFADTTRNNLSFQVLPRLEAAVRYTDIDDFSALGVDTSDQSFDVKYLVFTEEGYRPAVAVGIRDIFGDGKNGAEYIVASKSFGSKLTATAGIGWGRLGSYNGFGNPFGADSRPTKPDGGGGTREVNQWFRGNAAFFGGLEWATPVRGLTAKLEYSSDAYTREQTVSTWNRKSPFNFGLEYQPVEGVNLGAYYMYGSELGLRLTLFANPNRSYTAPDLGYGPAPVSARPNGYSQSTAWVDTPGLKERVAERLTEELEKSGVRLDGFRLNGTSVDLQITNRKNLRHPKAIGRTLRILALAMPHSVETFNVTLMNEGLPIVTTSTSRTNFENQIDRPNAGKMSYDTTVVSDAIALDGPGVWTRPEGKRFKWGIAPTIPLFFGSNGGLEADLQLEARAEYRIAKGFTIGGVINQSLLAFDRQTVSTSASTLPHVRSDAALYNNSKTPVIKRLTADYVFKPTPQLYARISTGMLERMFGGVSSELLWKPATNDWGLGAELNYVKQRDTSGAFGFLNTLSNGAKNEIVTGHASVYWDTGYRGLQAQLDVGRYLAGDWGGTVSMSRQFSNGWEFGGYFTFTEIDAVTYGKGNFTKGVKLSIPLRWTIPNATRSMTHLDVESVSGDGGARLDIHNRLYSMVRNYDKASLRRGWGSVWQ